MPLIPRIQSTAPLANAPGPVLDRNQRPTLDTRGVQQGLVQFNVANKAPLMDPNALSAPYEALGSIGRAIGQAGDVVGALAIKRQEAEADYQTAEADARMDRELADFENWKTTRLNEPGAWQSEWENRLAKMREEIGSNEKLNSRAREAINLRLVRWEGQSVAGVARDATKQTFALAKSAILSSADSALSSGDYERHEKALVEGQAKGYLFPHEVTAKRIEREGEQVRTARISADSALIRGDIATAKKLISEAPLPKEEKEHELTQIQFRHEQKQEVDSIRAMSYENPEMAEELAVEKEKAGKIAPLARIELVEESRMRRASMIRDAVADYKGRMQIGEKITAETLDADPRLNDQARDAVARMVDGVNNLSSQFERALVSAMDFDPSKFGSEREAITAVTMLEAGFEASFDGAMLQRLKSELANRAKGTDPKTAATDIGPALKMLDVEIESGALGPIDKPVMKDGKQVYTDPKKAGFVQSPGMIWGMNKTELLENDGKPVPLTERDKVAEEKAAAVLREIRSTLESEVASGKLKDQAAISIRSIELFKAKGGKMTPRQAMPENPLLPAIDAPKTDLNELLKKYGH